MFARRNASYCAGPSVAKIEWPKLKGTHIKAGLSLGNHKFDTATKDGHAMIQMLSSKVRITYLQECVTVPGQVS
jgi:hypothetical protein